MHRVPRLVLVALGLVMVGACTTTRGNGAGNGGSQGKDADRPTVALASAEPGRFQSSRPGTLAWHPPRR